MNDALCFLKSSYTCLYCQSPVFAKNHLIFLKILLVIKPLPLHKLIKIAFLCDQFVICTVLDDFSAVQNDNPVALANRGKSVRNDDKIAFNYLIF